MERSIMLELAVVACLISDPSKCRDVSLTFDSETATPMQCLMQAQPELAKWAGDHPNWKIERYTCRPAGQIAKT
jgi:hypothetical protein